MTQNNFKPGRIDIIGTYNEVVQYIRLLAPEYLVPASKHIDYNGGCGCCPEFGIRIETELKDGQYCVISAGEMVFGKGGECTRINPLSKNVTQPRELIYNGEIYDVELVSVPQEYRVKAMGALRKLFPMTIDQAHQLLSSLPKVIASDFTCYDQYKEIVKTLEGAGAQLKIIERYDISFNESNFGTSHPSASEQMVK